ncbi:MAG: SAM-dependent methyltransferase [Xanthomonadales bacterium]|nr:hypothetical protein [Xanthomonadales bacterium]MCC6592633.1 SAM-dependent methyltransferase [Xanthomonadales bacterium]MCE7931774.1 class I SAM-dependent methyltransferase [Xanthomonadales bacterium PRO6]
MLPEPDEIARAHSERMRAHIAAEIAAQGPIPFQRYMELALYAPGLGYYAAGTRKFGVGGDFVTAPELGEVYAGALAATLADTLRHFETPVLMEIGAGSGALAAGLLPALQKLDALPTRYRILERSADLRERQQTRLAMLEPGLAARVDWLDTPAGESFDGAILANEVLDALACARFELADEGFFEIRVDVAGTRFVECLAPPRPQLSRALAHLQAELPVALPVGTRSEILPELGAWLAAVTAPLRRGLVLLSDYGYGRSEYYRPERHDGTLICHYRQYAHADPYWYPGLNDLSASVDFTALAEAGIDAGFELLAYDHQAGFLLASGIEALQEQLQELGDRARLRLSGELKRLLLPGEMGERFKWMLLGRGVDSHLLPPRLCAAGQRHLL